MQKYVIIVAGGIGKRFKSKIPKQFLKLGEKIILMHSIQAFYNALKDTNIIVALPQDFFNLWEKLCNEHRFLLPHTLVNGGETRFHSVRNALTLAGEDGIIAVHDGARPLVTPKLIKRSFLEAEKFGNAIPAVPVNDSVRIFDDGKYKMINREYVKVIQTPQCFKASTLKNAYKQQFNESFTDDAAVVELFGEKIHLIAGEPSNIKITNDIDLKIAESILNY